MKKATDWKLKSKCWNSTVYGNYNFSVSSIVSQTQLLPDLKENKEQVNWPPLQSIITKVLYLS